MVKRILLFSLIILFSISAVVYARVSGPPRAIISNCLNKNGDKVIWNQLAAVTGKVYSDSVMDYYEIYYRYPYETTEWTLLEKVTDSTVGDSVGDGTIYTFTHRPKQGGYIQFYLYCLDLSSNSDSDTSGNFEIEVISAPTNMSSGVIGGI